MDFQNAYQQAKNLIIHSQRIVAFSGAGISVESGIPTFRGANGLWSIYDPSCLMISFFYQQPYEAWVKIKEIFYDFFGKAHPNPAHYALAKMEQLNILKRVITQNIDHLHQDAESQNVIEYHGTSRTLQLDNRRLEGKIPPGAKTGTKIRLAGVGPAGPNGQKSDIYLVVQVRPDARFERKGDDLYTEVNVDLYSAVLGGKLRVHTLGGEVVLTIPQGTQPGQKIRLSGRGMPHLRDPKIHGDLYVIARVTIPKQLNEQQKKLFEQLRKL